MRPVADPKEWQVLDFESIDWPRTQHRLEIFASSFAKSAPDVIDGASAEDWVSETLLTFLMSPNALGLNPDRGELAVFPLGVLHHKFLDHLKRDRRVAGSTMTVG